MAQADIASRFELTGGHLALNFINTVNSRPTERREELLVEYSDLVQWAEESGIVTRREGETLRKLAGESPDRAARALKEAIKIREALLLIFAAVSEGREIPVNALTLLNGAVREAGRHLRLRWSEGRMGWEWIEREGDLNSILWPVVRAAAELLVSEDIGKVRLCASESCDWIFLDTSRNHSRRWCEMKTCGNRDKARRHYERTKGE